MNGESYPVTKAAKVLGMSNRTVKKEWRNGNLDGFQTSGGHLRITTESVKRFQERGSTKETQHRGEPSGVLQNRRERVEEINLGNQELRAQRDASKLRKEIEEEAERDRLEQQRKEREQRREEERDRLEQQRGDRERRELASAAQAQRLDRERDRLERERRNKERQNAIEIAEKSLSIFARLAGEPTTWQIQLRRQVREALAELPPDASAEEISDAAVEVGQAVNQAYEEAEAATKRKESKESDARFALRHVSSYLRDLEREGEFTFDERYRLGEQLERRIRPELLEQIHAEPDLNYKDLEEIVENLVDDHLPEFVEEDDQED